MFHIGKSTRIVAYILAAACLATMPVFLAAGPLGDGDPAYSLNVDKVFAIDASGSIQALKIVGESFDSGNLRSLTLAGEALEIERASDTEIVVTLPDALEPGPYELAISVTDDVNRIDQGVAIMISLPAGSSAARGNSHRLVWSSAANPLDLDPAASPKALAGYQRRSYAGTSCPNNYFCMRRTGCLTGYYASGGGMAISGTNATDAYLIESFPYSNSAWETRILNQSGSSRTTTVWVVCVR